MDEAARALRRQGLGGVGVAEVMKAAGLTHGGFYAHFASREVLLAEALERAGSSMAQALEARREARRPRGASAFRELVEGYLSDDAIASPETTCPVAALSSELARCGLPVRDEPDLLQDAARRLVRQLVAGVRASLPASAPAQAAAAIAGTLVGALQLARTLGDGPEGRAVLASARGALLAQYDSAVPER